MTDAKPELLAPAGNMECLIAAVRNGADAVYFGGGAFNARRGAKNFTGDELKEAIDFCRLRGVKTYVTLNTILFDGELPGALSFASKLFSLKADGVIVQDIGLASLIREYLPELPVHASTQMGIHSPDGLRFCEENGIKRAVLSREVSLDEIRLMHEKSPVELEFFCHGALCMGFSGSCLYSSMAGERSGNRGTCAQPCRKNATVFDRRAGKDEFALSTNDICMIDELDSLSNAGVCSFKIEGRMKQPEYVATVTRIYRQALDGEKPRDARARLFEIFNRGEFSTSHIKGDSVRTGRVGAARPSKEQLSEAHESVRFDRPSREVRGRLSLYPGSPAKLELVSGGYAALSEGSLCEEANSQIDKARYAEQVKKLGSTPFFMNECEVEGEGFLPVSQVNALRREAVNALTRAILGEPREERLFTEADIAGFFAPAGRASLPPLLYERFRDEKSVLSSNADIVGFDPVDPANTDVSALSGCKKKLVLILPNVLITEAARSAYERLISSGAFAGLELNNAGQLYMGRGLSIRIAGIGMNAANSASFTKLLSLGITKIMPSPELTRAQLSALSERFGSVMIVNTFGRTPLMQLLHCPVKEYRGCRNCKGSPGTLKDGDGRRFPLQNVRFREGGNNACLVRLMNSAVTDIREAFTASGIGVFAVAETPEPVNGSPITRGHWARPVD